MKELVSNYLKYYLKDKRVASVLPTRRKVVRQACSAINFSQPLNVIEFGAGLGVFTRYIINRLVESSNFIAFETNCEMFAELDSKLRLRSQSVANVTLHNRSAFDVLSVTPPHLVGKIDVVISGIPLSQIGEQQSKLLFAQTRKLLRPQGMFIVYQVTPLFKDVVGENQEQALKQYFAKVFIKDALVNLPPLRIYTAQR